MPVVALVVCGAPLARRTGDMVRELTSSGWEVHLVGTPAARPWIGSDESMSSLEVSPQFDFRSPGHVRPASDPDLVAVCPATFNTVNKVALGLADNYATSLVCEALGVRTPVLAAPMINDKLWGHSALASSFATLRGTGVKFLDLRTGGAGLAPIASGTGDQVVSGFQPAWLSAAMTSIG